jgi:hypothetical protein
VPFWFRSVIFSEKKVENICLIYSQGVKNFKIVFILGRNSEFDLSEEIEINDDLLILKFFEKIEADKHLVTLRDRVKN